MFLLPGSSEEALVGLINQQNALSIPLEAGDLYYGKVKALSDGSISLPTVTMYDNEDYEGYARFKYTRINFNKVFGDQRPVIHDLGQTTLHNLLPVINKRLGINLQPRDIIDQKIDWIGGNEKANLVVTASTQSLGYEGYFIIQFTRIRPLLSVAIATKSLNVLHYSNPIDQGKKSMDMATWGIDFSGYQKTLALTGSSWVYPNEVRQMFADYGFSGVVTEGSGNLALYATKDLPRANPAFTNVIVQKGIDIADFKGDAYIHFNRS